MRKHKKIIVIMAVIATYLLVGCSSVSMGQSEPVREDISVDQLQKRMGQDGDSEPGNAESEPGNAESEPVDSQPDLDQQNDLPAIEQDSFLPDARTITIRMVGDILLHTPVEESACSDVDGAYDYSRIFDNTRDMIADADIALVNQEVIIGGQELGVSGYPAFNAPTEIGDALVDAGFDVVLHATNHALDKGKKGLLNCIEFWNTSHPDIVVSGIHAAEEEHVTKFVCVDDVMIAILNYTYGTNGIPMPEGMPYAVDLLDESSVKEELAYARSIADFVIVAPHWGTEYKLEPDSFQTKWTDIFLHNGVDLVIGTHPHVIEKVDMIHDDESDRDMLVYYSLGNFVNWTSGTGAGVADRMVGGMADIELTAIYDAGGDISDVYISDYSVTALVTDLHPGDDGVTVYPLSDYTPDMAAENEIIRQDSAFSYNYCVELCDNIWGDLWE